MSMAGLAGEAARRGRERQLRSFLRHEELSVKMALARAFHHNPHRVEVPREGVQHEVHVGPRAQKPPLPGKRPGLPPEPEPQVRATTVGYVAAPEPLVSTPSLPDTAAEAVDVVTVHFLLKDALKQLKEGRSLEEEEERRWMVQVKAMPELSLRNPRKRKKRRKRKLPRSSSHSSFGRARRRLRQWHARYVGLPGDVPFPAVFPSVVVRPAMLSIMAVTNQKDSTTLVGSGMCRVGFTGYYEHCVMFPSGVAKPKMRCILAGMDQIDSYVMVPMVQTAETVESPQLQSIQDVDISFVAQRQFSMVRTSQLTTPVAVRFQVVDAPVVQVVLAIPVVVNDRCARLRLCRKPSRSRSCSSSSSSTIPCCGAEADSHGPCDHGDSTVAVH